MEKYIDIQYITNVLNLGFISTSKIVFFEVCKNYIIFMLHTNDIVIYNIKNGKSINKHYTNDVNLIKSHKDKLFLVKEKELILINLENFDHLISYDLGEIIYQISLFDTSQLESVYVNSQHEIKYFAKGRKNTIVKNLYKENSKVDSLIYQKGILLWSTHSSLKVFNLGSKKMLIKKIFQTPNPKNFPIECFIYHNILCVNIHKEEIIIFHLPTEEQPFPIELIHLNQKNISNDYFIGAWVNNSLTKLSLISYQDKCVNLKIMKINNKQQNQKIDIYFEKKFNYISSDDTINFIFAKSISSVFLYNKIEMYFVTIVDKIKKMFRDINEEDGISIENLEIIYLNYSSFSLNEKYFVLIKIIENDSTNKDNQSVGGINIDKFEFLFQAIFSEKNPNKNIIQLYNSFVLFLWKKNRFLKLYKMIKVYFNSLLSEKSKREIINLFLKNNLYLELIKFIEEDTRKIEISKELTKIFDEYINSQKNKNFEKAIYCLGHIYRKNGNYSKSIELFINIKKQDDIFKILSTGNQDYIFKYPQLFNLLDMGKLMKVLDFIYYKDYSLCQKFYDKLFTLCNEKSIALFTFNVIEFDKNRLLISKEIAEKLFNITLKYGVNIEFINISKRNYITILLKFLNTYDKFEYNKLINENKEELEKKENYEIYVSILTFINNYKQIIDIYIDIVSDPEKCIKYIENANLDDNTKNDVYNYLKDKINNSKSLSSAKKLYFLLQFQDDFDSKEHLSLLNDIQLSGNKDNIEYVLMILEQLKLKVDILKISKEMTRDHLGDMLKSRKIYKNYGKNIYFEKDSSLLCSFDECEKNQKFEKGDKIICFQNCNHFFHKECIEQIKELYFNYDPDKINTCPICSQII